MGDARGGRNPRPHGGGRGRGRSRSTPATPGPTSGPTPRHGVGRGRGPTRSTRRAGAASGERRPVSDRPAPRSSAQNRSPTQGRSRGRSSTGSASRPTRTTLTGRAAVLALVLAALVISYASSLRAWSEQRSELAELRAEQAQRLERVEELEQKLRRWRDPAYVEAQARERFGWVMPGEVGYVVVGPEETAPPTDGAARRPRSPAPRSWWRDLWRSVEEAGDPPRPTTAPPRPKPATTIDPDAAASSGDDAAGRSVDGGTSRNDAEDSRRGTP